MSRIKLQPLLRYSFKTQVVVRTTDMNYRGHLGNDRVLALIHEARVDFLAGYGLSELDCGGVSLIMGDAAINFRGEAYAGDVLVIEVAAVEPTRKGFRLFYRITRESDGLEIALVETGMACYDYSTQKLQNLPPTLKNIFDPV